MACRAVASRWLVMPGDTTETLVTKLTWALMGCVGFVACALMTLLHIMSGRDNDFKLFMGIYAMGAWAAMLVYLFVRKDVGNTYAAVSTFIGLSVVAWFDLVTLVEGVRGWGYFVLVVDALLVARAPRSLRLAAVSFILLWLAITGAELAFRFGLLDIDSMLAYDERVEECTQPPCAMGVGGLSANIIPAALIIFADYEATTGFALAVDAEKRKMAAAVAVSRRVAKALADFDVTSAEACMSDEEATHLPEELAASFQRLIENLRAYRPYLPDSLIQAEDAVDDEDELVDSERRDHLSYSSVSTCSYGSVPSTVTPPPQGARSASQTSMLFRSTSEGMRLPGGVSLRNSSVGKPAQAIRFTRYVRDNARVSLLHVHAPALTFNNPDMYLNQHGEFLAEVVNHVKANKGLLNDFVANTVTASFNAFKPVVSHACSAIAAAQALRGASSPAAADTSERIMCAVATGVACVGHLGTDVVLRPCVFGRLPLMLREVADVGQLLGERVVCGRSTYFGVSLSVPMRILLHRVLFTQAAHVPQDDRGEMLLYTVVEDGTVTQGVDTYAEWMYALEHEPGKRWVGYNDVGFVYHRHGAAAALRELPRYEVAEELSAKFIEDLGRVRDIAMTPQVVLAAESVGTPLESLHAEDI